MHFGVNEPARASNSPHTGYVYDVDVYFRGEHWGSTNGQARTLGGTGAERP